MTKYPEAPIIGPKPEHEWEAWQTFNPGVILLENKVHFLYRAIGQDGISRFGYAFSNDGFLIDERLPYPVYEHAIGKTHFSNFSFYSFSSGYSFGGAEDPRPVRVEQEDTIYLTYTACKDAILFPEKIKGKYLIVHRTGDDIDFGFSSTLNFDGKTWIEEYRWIAPRRGWWDSKKVGAAAPPIKTRDGWIMLYHGVSDENIYRVGAVLLDLKNPVKVIGRTDNPIFEPETKYEKEGQVPNVVFPCGNVLLGDILFVYYGGADQVVGVATIKIKELIRVLKLCRY